jgi:hypothetical protein
MIYDKEDVDKMSEKIQRLITASGIDFLYEPAPTYIHGPNWTDELREKNGYKQIEGVWIREVNNSDYWLAQMNGVCKLVENVKHLSNELQLARRKIYEMEYGLRVAQKSLQKSLDMNKKEMTDE